MDTDGNPIARHRAEKWLTAQSGRDGSRHARRPVQERAAPTAFQRTSLLMKCNTEDGDCKNFLPAEHAEINARIGLSKKDAGLVFHEFSGRAS